MSARRDIFRFRDHAPERAMKSDAAAAAACIYVHMYEPGMQPAWSFAARPFVSVRVKELREPREPRERSRRIVESGER